MILEVFSVIDSTKKTGLEKNIFSWKLSLANSLPELDWRNPEVRRHFCNPYSERCRNLHHISL